MSTFKCPGNTSYSFSDNQLETEEQLLIVFREVVEALKDERATGA